MAKHMDDTDRDEIERLLRMGWLVAQIASKLGRPDCTIAREIRNRRIDSNKGVRRTSSATCALYDSCRRTKVCPVDCGMRKLCKNCVCCVEACADFLPSACHRLTSSPFVCNGCERERSCPLPKKFYIAGGAQAHYEGLLHESRRGVHASDEQLARINEVFTRCTRQGQSVRNVMANNPDLFGFCERTMYNYVNLKKFDAIRGDLPFACSRKPRKARPVTKTDAKCRVGRTYKDLISYWIANPSLRDREAEMDGLEGQKRDGRYIFTFIFNEDDLALGFISDSKDSAACTEIFGRLWDAAGPALFKRLFAIIVTDNGPEFSDPVAIEANPLFVPRGEDEGKEWKDCASPDKYRARVFYCNSYSPKQKAHAERMHEEVRKHYWGYAPDEQLTMQELHVEKFQGIRPAVGYPSLPDTSLNFVIDELIGMRQIGIRLTESGAMKPHASVSGLMIAHPQARYFMLGKIGEDQLADYARRRGLPVEMMRKFLGSNL
jgi:IS30 family transposase